MKVWWRILPSRQASLIQLLAIIMQYFNIFAKHYFVKLHFHQTFLLPNFCLICASYIAIGCNNDSINSCIHGFNCKTKSKALNCHCLYLHHVILAHCIVENFHWVIASYTLHTIVIANCIVTVEQVSRSHIDDIW